jgi:hypothetical protein
LALLVEVQINLRWLMLPVSEWVSAAVSITISSHCVPASSPLYCSTMEVSDKTFAYILFVF